MNNLVTQSAEKFEEYVNTNGPLIGFDLSPLLAFIFLTFLIDIFDSVVFT